MTLKCDMFHNGVHIWVGVQPGAVLGGDAAVEQHVFAVLHVGGLGVAEAVLTARQGGGSINE